MFPSVSGEGKLNRDAGIGITASHSAKARTWKVGRDGGAGIGGGGDARDVSPDLCSVRAPEWGSGRGCWDGQCGLLIEGKE